MDNRIRKSVELNTPISRVWEALTNHNEFGKWFRVKLEHPFAPGKISQGHITYPGYEHLKWEAEVQTMEPGKRFSFTWHPYAIDPNHDYSNETPTLVEFTLEQRNGGTLLTVTESGFEEIPASRRAEALKMNEGGWEEQMKNIKNYLDVFTTSV